MNTSAKWIWKNGETDENTWMCFVKKFDLGRRPSRAEVKIAADSKYWLYVNGKKRY